MTLTHMRIGSISKTMKDHILRLFQVGLEKVGCLIMPVPRAHCCVGARQLGLPSVAFANGLGISPSAVSRAILRGQKLVLCGCKVIPRLFHPIVNDNLLVHATMAPSLMISS